MMMMTMMMMHQRLSLFFFFFFCASFHGGDTTVTTAIHINTHGLLVVSTQITRRRRRAFVKESSSSVPQWTLVIEEASVKDACDTNNDTSVLFLEEPLFLEDWHCNNTLCVALRNSTFVIPLCDDDDDDDDEEEEGLTRTLVVTLWQQQEESSYRRPLTRRLATLPKMARPQREISPVAKVTLNALLLGDNEHFDVRSKSISTTTMREWIPSLLWISICLIFYLRAWRRGSRYDEDRQEQMDASRNSIHPLHCCQNHIESSFVQLAAEASLHQTTLQEEAPRHLQQHSQHSQQPNVNPHCTAARWSEGNTLDQLPNGLASLPFSPDHSRIVVVAPMCDTDKSCTESIVRDSDMHYPNNEQEETEIVMGDCTCTSSANEPEIGDCKKSMEKLPLLDHHHHHRVLEDRKESSVQQDVSQHPFLQGDTAKHHKTQDEVSSKLYRHVGSDDNDANASVDAEQTPSQPVTRKQDSEFDGMNQHGLHGPQDTFFLSDPNTSLPLNGNGNANAREPVQSPNHNGKEPTRLSANSQKDVAVGASNEMCNNSPTGFRNMVDTDTANHIQAHFGGSGATMNQPVETSTSGSRTPKESTQPESLSPILLIATFNETSNERTHLGPSKEPQDPSLSEQTENLGKNYLQLIQEGSQEDDAMEQSNETPLCNESAKSAGGNLEAHASSLTWLPASPQHRRTTEVLTQFSEGTLNHLDEAVGSTQMLDAFQSHTNPQLDTITMPPNLALASTGTKDERSCSGSYVSTLPPDSDYCSAADEAGTFSPPETASSKESQPPQGESNSTLVERTQSQIGKAKGPSLEHFPPLTVVVNKARPKMQKLLSRKRHRGSSDSQDITEKPIIPSPSKKPRPFKNSKIVPDWVPSNRLQNASKQFVGEGTSWDAIAPTTTASVAKKRPASKRKSFSSQKICK
jgi:hypothetical protein